MPSIKNQIRQKSNTVGTAMQCGVGNNSGTNLTPGTRNCSYAMVQALKDNANSVTFGGPGVVGSLAARTGIALDPGEVSPVDIDAIDQLYIDVITSGDGITAILYE